MLVCAAVVDLVRGRHSRRGVYAQGHLKVSVRVHLFQELFERLTLKQAFSGEKGARSYWGGGSSSTTNWDFVQFVVEECFSLWF